MKIVDTKIDEMFGADSETDSDIIRSVKREVLKSLAVALRLEAEDLSNPPDLYLKSKIDFYEAVQQFEARLIKQALARSGGNQRTAAQLLGLNVTTLNHKIRILRERDFLQLDAA